MFYALEKYLARLNDSVREGARVWLDQAGRARGKYFNMMLTSAFQPVRVFDKQVVGTIVAHEGFIRSCSESDAGLHVWKLLDPVASDDESVELDRLCRILHTINFYRQAPDANWDLHLSVHARLLTAVDSNHGIAFRRILNLLALPHERIVLQMPSVVQHQGWLLNYVFDNYRRNGFQIGIGVADAGEALMLLEKIRPNMIKIDARELNDFQRIEKLLRQTAQAHIRVVFKRVENAAMFESLRDIGRYLEQPIYAQGYQWDQPQSVLQLADAVTENRTA